MCPQSYSDGKLQEEVGEVNEEDQVKEIRSQQSDSGTL